MKLLAQRFLNLLTLLPMPNKIRSVRATYCTSQQPVPSDKFLFEKEPFTPSKYSTVSPIVHLTPQDLVACLDEHDVEVITATVARMDQKINADKKALVISKHGSGGYKPTNLPLEHSKEIKRECGGCHKLAEAKDLSRCEFRFILRFLICRRLKELSYPSCRWWMCKLSQVLSSRFPDHL